MWQDFLRFENKLEYYRAVEECGVFFRKSVFNFAKDICVSVTILLYYTFLKAVVNIIL